MTLVSHQFNILDLKLIEITDLRIDPQSRRFKCLRPPCQLQPDPLHLILIDVGVIDNVRQQARPQIRHLSQQMYEHRVLRSVEGNPQTPIRAALYKHTIEPPVRHVPHGQKTTGVERSRIQVRDLPEI